MDRKTVRRYVEAAQAAGLTRDGRRRAQLMTGWSARCVGWSARSPGRARAAWEALCAREEQIRAWVRGGLTIVKIGGLLARRGVVVPYRTCTGSWPSGAGSGGRRPTVRVADGEPGVECQIDFAQLGLLSRPGTGPAPGCTRLIFTAVLLPAHVRVAVTFAQTLDAVVAGCEAAWEFFGGVFRC